MSQDGLRHRDHHHSNFDGQQQQHSRGNTPPAPPHAHRSPPTPGLQLPSESTNNNNTTIQMTNRTSPKDGDDNNNNNSAGGGGSSVTSPLVGSINNSNSFGSAVGGNATNTSASSSSSGISVVTNSSATTSSSAAGEVSDSPTTAGTPTASGGGAKDTSIVAGFAAESSLPLHQSALIAFLYTMGSTIFFLLIRYSKRLEKEGALVYDNAAAVFFMELFKWTFSVCAMWFRTGKFLPISVFREGTWRIGLYYAVPSGIYVIYNNFTFFNLTSFDPATYQVFMQTRVLFTGVLYSAIFHKHLSQQKWISLILLTFGVMSKYFHWPLTIDGGVFFMLFQASLSAFAGVYNEFLLKRDISMDVNEQNFFMYSFALVFNLGFGLLRNPDYYTSGKVISNLNSIFFWIVLTGALMGISASLVLKFINVIVKAFASATEVLITAVLAAMFLGEALTLKDFIACCIVMVAIYLYYHVFPNNDAAATSKSNGNSGAGAGRSSAPGGGGSEQK